MSHVFVSLAIMLMYQPQNSRIWVNYDEGLEIGNVFIEEIESLSGCRKALEKLVMTVDFVGLGLDLNDADIGYVGICQEVWIDGTKV